ncbi:hypothetical protein [Halorussus sp. MSC15.2]|nr:hypothetical protein [Halorussus sp. MSC15.2]NEU58563.1 hypothetical protein [Halorussus sp. MSC15.2]
MVGQNVKAGLRIADRGYVLDVGENRHEESVNEFLDSERVRDAYLGK